MRRRWKTLSDCGTKNGNYCLRNKSHARELHKPGPFWNQRDYNFTDVTDGYWTCIKVIEEINYVRSTDMFLEDMLWERNRWWHENRD